MEIPTSLDVLSFVCGALLISAGLLGGGLKVGAVDVPKITSPARVLSVLGGFAFLILGLWLRSPAPAVPPQQPSSSYPTAPSQTDITTLRADATLDYWNQTRVLWKECDINTATAMMATANDADAFKAVADGFHNCSDRIQSLPISNVDDDLSVEISNQTNKMDAIADLFFKAAYLARLTAPYDRAKQPYPIWLQKEVGQLTSSMRQAKQQLGLKSSPNYMKSLRVSLTKRYNRDFLPF